MIEFREISFVSISDAVVQKVAERTGRTFDDVKAYLAGSDQDDELLKAFLFYGIGPFNKTFT